MDIRAGVSGMGQITGGSVVIVNSKVEVEILNSDIDFQGADAYATNVVLTSSSNLITGTNWDTPSIESLTLSNNLGDSAHVYNMTVVNLWWSGSSIYYNLKVTGTARLDSSSHNVYGMFYVVNHTMEHTWDYGYIYTYADTDIYMAGNWNCTSTSSSACTWYSYTGDGKVKLDGSFWSPNYAITLSGISGIYEVNGNFVGDSSISVTSLTGSVNFFGAVAASGMITLDSSSVTGDATFSGTIDLKDTTFGGHVVFSSGTVTLRSGLVFSNALVNLNANTHNILGDLAVDNLRFANSYNSVLNIKADVVVQNFTSYGIINLDNNITIYNWVLYYSTTYVHGDVFILVNDTYDSNGNTLELYNSTLVFVPGVEAMANSMYLHGDATFINYGHVTFHSTTFELDAEAVVVNAGAFIASSGYTFSFDVLNTGVTGGQFVNIGILSNEGSATFDFNNGIPFYQCKSGSLDLNFDYTPTLLLSSDAVVNGKINVIFSTQNGYDSVSSSYGTQYGYWDTRKGTLFNLPLNGLASTYTIIAGGTASYSKGTSCQDTSSSTTTYMTYWKSKDINIFKCKSFDPISIPSNDLCNLVKQPLFNGSSKTTLSLAALAVLAVFMLFF